MSLARFIGIGSLIFAVVCILILIRDHRDPIHAAVMATSIAWMALVAVGLWYRDRHP